MQKKIWSILPLVLLSYCMSVSRYLDDVHSNATNNTKTVRKVCKQIRHRPVFGKIIQNFAIPFYLTTIGFLICTRTFMIFHMTYHVWKKGPQYESKKTYDYVTCCHERVNVFFFPGFKTLNKVPIEK